MSAAVDFLKGFDPDGWHNLVAIEPETRAIRGVTLAPGEWAKAEAFIERFNGKWNLYFSVNEPKPGSRDTKLGGDDIAAIRAVYSDVDPEAGDLAEQRMAIVARANKTFVSCKPGKIIDSGGGYQFFWPLAEKLDALVMGDAAEHQGRGIANLIGGDAVENIDRIMRLPGTWNIPGPDKVAKGRVKALTKLEKDASDKFTLEQLAKFYAPIVVAKNNDRDAGITEAIRALDMGYVQKVGYYDELETALRQRFERARAGNARLEDLWSGAAPPKDSSSSGWVFALSRLLKYEGGFSAEEFGALCWVWDRADYNKIDARLIARAWERAPNGPDVNLLDVLPDDPENLSKSKKFQLEPFDEINVKSIVSAPALIKGLLDQGAMSVGYGDSNAGKTFVFMDMAFHVAAGMNYAGLRTQQGMVVYVAAEGGQGAKKRIVALQDRYPGAKAQFMLLASPVDLRNEKADLVPLVETIRAIGQPIALLVIDTLSRAMAGGDENSSVDMGNLVKNFDRLRQAIKPAHLLVVHHSGKDRAKGARGHSLLRAATDTEIEVTAQGKDGAPGLIAVTKQRDMDGEWSRPFRLHVHKLGLDGDGDVITSCTVRLLDGEEVQAAAVRLTEKERNLLIALEALTAEREGAGAFGADEIGAQLTDGSTVEAIRQTLRRMALKGLVKRPEAGKWALGAFKRSLYGEEAFLGENEEAFKNVQEPFKDIFS